MPETCQTCGGGGKVSGLTVFNAGTDAEVECLACLGKGLVPDGRKRTLELLEKRSAEFPTFPPIFFAMAIKRAGLYCCDRLPRWRHVSCLLALGEIHARAVCKRLSLDPDTLQGGGPCLDCEKRHGDDHSRRDCEGWPNTPKKDDA